MPDPREPTPTIPPAQDPLRDPVPPPMSDPPATPYRDPVVPPAPGPGESPVRDPQPPPFQDPPQRTWTRASRASERGWGFSVELAGRHSPPVP